MRRLYACEILAVANFVIVMLLFHDTARLTGSPVMQVVTFAFGMALQAAAAIGVRIAIAAVRKDRGYLRVIRTRRWITDTLRLVFAASLVVVSYGWVKLVVPIYHPRLFDQQLWNLDRLLFFGLSPNIFFLDLFGTRGVLRFVDWSYANIFYVSTLIGTGYFLSEPSRRVRVAFANGNALLWAAGGWLYLLVPSLGPALRFPDIWLVHADALNRTQGLQALLMRNYQNVLRNWNGQPAGPIRFIFGIGAFPSLHVGFQTFVFLWMRRLWTSGEVLFGIFVVTIFFGSMITGWHYMVDGLAGMVMAAGAFALFWRSGRIGEWLRLRAAIRCAK